ncbi:MAG: S8 family serine peptidase [bacterium]|nr:S8 family serine peptidase [bacterium]
MKKRGILNIGIGLLFLLTLPFSGLAERWILNAPNYELPADLEIRIEQAGGTLIGTIGDVGIVVADFTREEDVKMMEADGYEVIPDDLINWLGDGGIPQGDYIGLNDEGLRADGFNEDFYSYQWHLPVIGADRAWQTGVTGAGARVAVLDTGIWYHHPDLSDNIDFAASTSFVPGITDFLDDQGHGTHVAGIIAAADNNWGTIGVAPKATLIAVKVLDCSGTGRISWILDGITHAVNQGADIINLSLGAYVNENGNAPYYTAGDVTLVKKAVRKVINWAFARGVLVVHSAGNAGLDFDSQEAGFENIISIPTEQGHGIIVSATGPVGLENFDTSASYTNYGKSSIWVAAPGGDYRNYPLDGWWNDMVFSTSIDGWQRAAGTSISAAIVSGVAALVVDKYGSMPAWKLKKHLTHAADDLGCPGKDPYYGKGRINAYKAVTK